MPEFSIICPVYNREHLIQNAIQSVLNQIFIDWELIVVDDGSTDNSKFIVEKYLTDIRIKYFYQHNQGPSIARNFGIQNAKGNFICFLDSDDYYYKNHLSNFEINIKKKNDLSLVCLSSFYSIYKGKLSKSRIYDKQYNPIFFVLTNFVSLNSVCISRMLLSDIQFDERWRYFEDTHLLVRLLLKYPLIQSEEYTCVLNNHPNRGTYTIYNEKNTFDKIENNISAIKDLFEKHGKEIIEITQKPYLREYLVSEKYIHHANGALIYGHPILSFQLILKAISSDKDLIHRRLYLRYFLKYPIYSLFYIFKKRL